MPRLPIGCDYQGRHPEAAPQSQEGACGPTDDAETPHIRTALLIATAFCVDWVKDRAFWCALLGVPAAVALIGFAVAVWP